MHLSNSPSTRQLVGNFAKQFGSVYLPLSLDVLISMTAAMKVAMDEGKVEAAGKEDIDPGLRVTDINLTGADPPLTLLAWPHESSQHMLSSCLCPVASTLPALLAGDHCHTCALHIFA